MFRKDRGREGGGGADPGLKIISGRSRGRGGKTLVEKKGEKKENNIELPA